MVTRRCAMFAEGTTNACSGPVSGVPGTMRVLDTGVLDVNGNSVGVNLMDQYRLEVSGTLLLSGTAGYVAADRGTSLSLIPKASTGVGQLLIANDGGWYEGRTDYGQTTLSAIVNGGLIRKTAGTGTSVVIGTYSQVGAGAVRVDSGTLSMPDGLVTKVQVAAGRTYAKGACTTASYGCAPVATVDPGSQRGVHRGRAWAAGMGAPERSRGDCHRAGDPEIALRQVSGSRQNHCHDRDLAAGRRHRDLCQSAHVHGCRSPAGRTLVRRSTWARGFVQEAR